MERERERVEKGGRVVKRGEGDGPSVCFVCLMYMVNTDEGK